MAEPVKLDLSNAAEEKLKRHLKNRIRTIEDGLNTLHTDKIVKWRKAYEAVPKEEKRAFPFPNASNLVVPVIAIFSDTLKARVMSAVLKTRPPWVVKLFGEIQVEEEKSRSALEEFLEYVGVEPTELDLYRVYNEWFGEAIKYGTSVVKCPHEVIFNDLLLEPGDGLGTGQESAEGSKPQFLREIEYSGPRPEKIPFEDFGAPPGAKTIDACDIRYHRRRLLKHELEERKFFSIYDAAAVDSILDKPDRSGPGPAQVAKEQTLGVQTIPGVDTAEWDVYECWLKWPSADGRFRPKIIATYHLKTDTLLRAIYDEYKYLPFIMARLFYRDDMLHGYGFAETQWMFQEEVSELHNSRNDNRLVANTRVWRVSEDSKLHKGFEIYPSAMLPAEKDEIEALQAGDISPETINDERFSFELAERRAGVSPPMQGMGAGGPGKRGIYTSMGTLSIMQEGNRRTDLNISDMRHSHTRLGRVLLADYAKHDIRKELLQVFGDKAKFIEQAMRAIKSGRMGLPVYSSTASINKEVEKQSDIMLVQIMTRHYSMIAQLLQAANAAVTPPNVKEYLFETIKSSNLLMKSVLRNFDRDDVDVLVPEPKLEDGKIVQPPPSGVDLAGISGGSVIQ